MPSIQTYIFRLALRTLRMIRGGKTPTLQEARRRFRKVGRLTKIHSQVKISRLGANGIPCEYFETSEVSAHKVVVFVHGGGYVVGSLDIYRGWLSQFVFQSKIPVLAIGYQQAPEHPFPTALSNTLSAYEWALQQYPQKEIYLMGDSAGGGLSLAMLLQMREEKIPMPKKCVLIAPWVDLELKRDSIKRLAHRDLIMREQDLRMLARLYAPQTDLSNPFISPINADLHQLPPILIHQGTEDLFLDEVKELYQKLIQAGNQATLEVWKGMPHVWHLMYDKLPEARKATANIIRFLSH